jgi:8-oxo-dGTP pyrophosphatase MutT (NUDIX family)
MRFTQLNNTTPMPKTIKPAATVVIVREQDAGLEVLLLERNSKLDFAASAWVFPGGKVEKYEMDQAQGDVFSASQIAVCREAKEETGLTVDKDEIVAISHWTTPDFRTKRFATQFFIGKVDANAEITVDGSEIIGFKWLTPTQAIEDHKDGKLSMMAPTLVTLSDIERHPSFTDLIAYFKARLSPIYAPRVNMISRNEGVFLYSGDSGYEDNKPELRKQLNRCEMRKGIIEHFNNLDAS